MCLFPIAKNHISKFGNYKIRKLRCSRVFNFSNKLRKFRFYTNQTDFY